MTRDFPARAMYLVFAACIPITAWATFPKNSRTDLPSNDKGPGVANHPVGVIPGPDTTIPNGWPLAPDGSIMCITCHASIPIGAGGAATLRTAGGDYAEPKAFCATCHKHGEDGAGGHWLAVSKAHLTADVYRASSSNHSSHDSTSRTCLSCHDGVNASDAAYGAGSHGWASISERSRNHPVDVPYPSAGKRRAEVPLRPALAVPPAINISGGIVSCVSCHNLYASDQHRLSLPIEGSQLCFGCHDLD